jgi:hypothetical protein
MHSFLEDATLKELRGICESSDGGATFQGCASVKSVFRFVPGLPERNAGLELANAFNVITELKPKATGIRVKGSELINDN